MKKVINILTISNIICLFGIMINPLAFGLALMMSISTQLMFIGLSMK